MAEEATFVIVKPDAIKRGLVGVVLSRLETLHLHIIGAKVVRVSRELAEEHYHHLREKPFFGELLDYLEGKIHDVPYVLALVFWGADAIRRVRELTGLTHPERAEPTSIRGSLGRITGSGVMENVVHASSDSQEAEREIQLWFKPTELLRDLNFPLPKEERDRVRGR